MMILVWLIDILVIGIKILGGRMTVNPILRFGLWLAVLSTVAAGIAVVGYGLVELQHQLGGDVAAKGMQSR
ncbi:hypothetical protein IU485_11875 [Nocardia cyriacigeorgica]|uniref:hypothetical protein n=1 Tax=Nocardia cyriacigeorgica TaxID=135487 RepID=UPI001894B83A|nr:hypothetical protein [Nocardia cyriacigeorgica]MBF6082058.1 hypothetical protein [Nocardia cyriacigeorgica]MBF6286229.1 hypothetical protein [Nocardia cyriacigeorgica]MBF6426195.1 hypothetical protein [Nocardia cyriacigeorgica]BDT89280.1 hypothetical protein FMUAM8_50440 [Nocardia cyriacigeorgica]BDU08673.1 hypothetical protein FMUBM48_49360 [Nocardia cyriacigeorgica]